MTSLPALSAEFTPLRVFFNWQTTEPNTRGSKALALGTYGCSVTVDAMTPKATVTLTK